LNPVKVTKQWKAQTKVWAFFVNNWFIEQAQNQLFTKKVFQYLIEKAFHFHYGALSVSTKSIQSYKDSYLARINRLNIFYK